MASLTSIQAKVKSALNRVRATNRVVKFRQTTVTGGNPRLGIGGTTTVVDTVAEPQPAVAVLDATDLATSGGLFQPGDYQFTFDGTVSESLLRTCLLVYGTDVLQPVHVRPASIFGGVAAWTVVARTVAPGE